MKDRLGKSLLNWRVRTVLPHVEGRLLDIGCGTNLLVKSYQRGGVGVDVYPWEGADLVVPSTAHLPFKDGEFDTVTIIAALNHIPDRADVLREARRVLRPGGHLLITMIPPGISKVWHALRRPWDSDQNERGMKEGEVWGLTRGQIIDLFRQTGFSLEFEHRFMLGLNWFAKARKVERAAVAAA